MTEWFEKLPEINQIMLIGVGIPSVLLLAVVIVDKFTEWGERRALRKIRRG